MVLNLLTGQKYVFRPAGAIRCTDSREAWQGRGARGIACRCKISVATGGGNVAQNTKNFHFLVKSPPTGATPLTDFKGFLYA